MNRRIAKEDDSAWIAVKAKRVRRYIVREDNTGWGAVIVGIDNAIAYMEWLRQTALDVSFLPADADCNLNPCFSIIPLIVE